MDEPHVVGVRQTLQDLPRHLPGMFDRERAVVVHLVAERPALHVLHHDVERAVGVHPEVQHLDDVGADDAHPRLGLAHEPRPDGLVGGVFVPQELHRHAVARALVPALVDGAHAAHAEPLQDGVAVADQLAQERIAAHGSQRRSGHEERVVLGATSPVLGRLGAATAGTDVLDRHGATSSTPPKRPIRDRTVARSLGRIRAELPADLPADLPAPLRSPPRAAQNEELA